MSSARFAVSSDLADPSCTFRPVDENLDHDQRWSTWLCVERGARGPRPRPEWVVTDDSAVDTELGVLKTGKEADVHLVERASRTDPRRSVVMAAKRYRAAEHRSFRRSTTYTEGRRVRDTRDMRAMAKGTAHGREVAAGQWAAAEWEALCSLWTAGVPVPYPVQVDGTEILMEYVSVDGAAAPRLAQTRPEAALRDAWFDQLREAMGVLARRQLAHGDLSAYNILAAGERLVIIDLPQVVDIVANPRGSELLLRDCINVCSWFRARGADADPHELHADLVAQAW
ncbi:MAG: serine/threonine protein kinase [Nocardioidaceae bacterium]|nr:serine/threonine protein kinase [Nocardioidaceae bacterium]